METKLQFLYFYIGYGIVTSLSFMGCILMLICEFDFQKLSDVYYSLESTARKIAISTKLLLKVAGSVMVNCSKKPGFVSNIFLCLLNFLIFKEVEVEGRIITGGIVPNSREFLKYISEHIYIKAIVNMNCFSFYQYTLFISGSYRFQCRFNFPCLVYFFFVLLYFPCLFQLMLYFTIHLVETISRTL